MHGYRNVRALALDAVAARLPSAVARVTTDGPLTLRLVGLRPGTRVIAGGAEATAGPDGSATIGVGPGTSVVSW